MSADAPTDKESRNQWGKGPVIPGGRVPELFKKYPNLYGDLSANSAGCAIMRDPAFGLEFFRNLCRPAVLCHRYGKYRNGLSLGQWLDEQAANGALSRRAYEKICFKNAQAVFGL